MLVSLGFNPKPVSTSIQHESQLLQVQSIPGRVRLETLVGQLLKAIFFNNILKNMTGSLFEKEWMIICHIIIVHFLWLYEIGDIDWESFWLGIQMERLNINNEWECILHSTESVWRCAIKENTSLLTTNQIQFLISFETGVINFVQALQDRAHTLRTNDTERFKITWTKGELHLNCVWREKAIWGRHRHILN